MLCSQNFAEFKKVAGFPGVWGVIDCTHIPVRIRAENSKTFYNRKNFTSLNVEAIVGPDMSIMEFICKWPGSTHDSTIFKTSLLYQKLREDPGEGHLLGDAGYAIEPFLMTPFRSNVLNSAERINYNKSLSATRVIVERVFGCWKSKFQCLKDIRVTISTGLMVITACAALWNFTLAEGDRLLDYEMSTEEGEQMVASQHAAIVPSGQGNHQSRANAKREMIVNIIAGQM